MGPGQGPLFRSKVWAPVLEMVDNGVRMGL